MDEFKLGDRVVVKETLYYNGRHGKLIPTSEHPDDPWDFYVLLDDTATIGVMNSQIEKEQ
jgi:hypothetical protein